jgi:hypothetical protein
MPWTAQDAAAKNFRVKGSKKLQRQWAAVANKVLAAELADGTARKQAEGRAIAAANADVAKNPAAKKPARGEPHGASTRPRPPVRTVTEAPPVARAGDPDLRLRLSPLAPASLNEETRTVRAVLATEDPCISRDLRTGKGFLEVYLMSGMEPVTQVPLCDTHKRDSIDRVKGSVRAVTVNGDQVEGDLCVSDAEYPAWTKIREHHVTDVSAGFEPLETTEIKPGTSKVVAGRIFTAPKDRSLFVHTKWRLREVSLTPIGSDVRAKIRAQGIDSMKEPIRKWLEVNMKLRAEATEEEAQTLWDSLKAEDRTRAEDACRDEEEEDEDDEDEDEDEDATQNTPSTHRVTRHSVVTEEHRSAEELERVRTEAVQEGRTRELTRQRKIRALAKGDIPAEIVTRAIDENWGMGRVRRVFLNIFREAKTLSVGGGGNVEQIELTRGIVGPAIHSRSHEADCTVASLGASLLTRNYSGNQDPCDLLGGYQASPAIVGDDGKPEAGQTFTVRSDITRMLSGRARHASDDRRKAAERLLDMGDRYRGLSPMDLVDECNRLEGRGRTSFDREERVRAAMSGSALSAIFTQNVCAQFLGGYLDAADTTQGWTTETDVLNFLENERAIYGKMGQLQKLGKGGTAADLDTSDWNEVYKIFRYAGKFTVDEQDFINDRFGALAQMSPQDMGLSARQIRANLVYALLLANPTLNQDSVSVFNAAHNNIVTGQVTDFATGTPTANAGPFQDATTLMGKQRLRNRVLNLRPRYVLSGTDLEWAVGILYKSQQRIIAAGSGGTYNPLAAEGANVEDRQDGRLDPLGCYDNDTGKTFYPYTTTGTTAGRSGMAIMAARPGEQGAKTVEIGYRIGTGRAPRIRSAILREGSGQYGMSWDANLDIGAKILDFRGLVLITGGGSQLAATSPNPTA